MSEPMLVIHPVYREKLQQALRQPQYERSLQGQPDLVLAQATSTPVTLTALIEPTSRMIKVAAHQGCESDTQRGLLEVLCHFLADRTVEEAHDHATIRVENALRDPNRPRPVSGIVSPENADPAFGLLTALARGLALDYWRQVPFYDEANFFHEPASEGWLSLSVDARLERLGNALADALAGPGAASEEVVLVDLEDDVKVVLDFGGPSNGIAKGELMMRLERHLQQAVEPSLQLYSTERRDNNKLRRL